MRTVVIMLAIFWLCFLASASLCLACFLKCKKERTTLEQATLFILPFFCAGSIATVIMLAQYAQ